MAYLWFYKNKIIGTWWLNATSNSYPDKIHYHSAFP
jgi:hypothetical protein